MEEVMNEDVFAEKLAHFKQNEKPEAVLLVAGNPELIRLTVAWTNTAVTRTKRTRQPSGLSDTEVWNWLWKHAQYSIEELFLKSSLPKYGFDHKMQMLIGNRVLYPDGTVNAYVQRYLRERVLKLFQEKPKRRGRKTE